MKEELVAGRKILDIFFQGAGGGIPSHWCVQYKDESSVFVDCEYFGTLEEANDYAAPYGYKEEGEL